MIPELIIPKCLWYETPTHILFTVNHTNNNISDIINTSIDNHIIFFKSTKYFLNITLFDEIIPELSLHSTFGEKTLFKLSKKEKKMWKCLINDVNMPTNWLSIDWDCFNGNDESDFSNSHDEKDENEFSDQQLPELDNDDESDFSNNRDEIIDNDDDDDDDNDNDNNDNND